MNCSLDIIERTLDLDSGNPSLNLMFPAYFPCDHKYIT